MWPPTTYQNLISDRFWGIFGYFHQNFTKTQILEFSVNYMVQKCFGSLKTSQRTLEIILSQYNGENNFLSNFENYPWTFNFLENPWFWKNFCVFLLKNLVTFEGQFFYFFFNCFFWSPPTKTLRTPEIPAYRLKQNLFVTKMFFCKKFSEPRWLFTPSPYLLHEKQKSYVDSKN